MPDERRRAFISDDEEFQICSYTLEFPQMRRTKLAEKIQTEVRWPGKPPEIEVLERKISHYRKHMVDHPEDNPWSMATLDRYPISPGAIPAVLTCWKQRVQEGTTLTIREAKWVSRLQCLMADEVHRIYVLLRGTKWIESETWCDGIGRQDFSSRQFSSHTQVRVDEAVLHARDDEWGTAECPECGTPIGIGSTTQKATCIRCQARFDVIRVPSGPEDADAGGRATSVVKNIAPIIRDIDSLSHYARGYAHLELIYELIGQPFDSRYMDMLLMRLRKGMPDLDQEPSLLPYLALGIQDFKQFRDKIRRQKHERPHRKERQE